MFRIRCYRSFDEQEDWEINTDKKSFGIFNAAFQSCLY